MGVMPPWYNRMEQRRRNNAMTTQTPATEERLSRLEGAYEQVDARLEDLRSEMNERLGEMNERLNELARGQQSLREEMQRGQESLRLEIRALRNNMILLTGGTWATLVAGLIAVFTTQ